MPGAWVAAKADPGAGVRPHATAAPGAQAVADPANGTGDPRVDQALARLDRLDNLPVAEHVGEYDVVHRALQDALTAIDES
jgi:hypothetical protein